MDAAAPAAQTERLASIDILRGLTIFLMIFVNDIAGVDGTPAWLKHFAPSDGNGMTLVDVVFPAFLFIVGLSIPLAFRAREHRGEATRSTVRHIVTRTVSLLVIGVLMVNADHVARDGILDPNLWTLWMYAGVFLVWVHRPSEGGQHARTLRRLHVLGLLIVISAILLYRAEDGSGLIQLRTRWWGILGLIGWAYLIAALVYLLARGNRVALLIGIAGLFGLYFVVACGWMGWLDTIGPFVRLSCTLGSHSALVLLGAFMGRIFLPQSRVWTPHQRIAWGSLYAVALAVAGWLLYLPHGSSPCLIINKNLGTPPWCLFSAAITAAVLVAVYWLVDRRSDGGPPGAAQLAGRNALFAYILAPFLYALFAFAADLTGTPNLLSVLAAPFSLGLARSIALSMLVMAVAAWLSHLRIALKI